MDMSNDFIPTHPVPSLHSRALSNGLNPFLPLFSFPWKAYTPLSLRHLCCISPTVPPPHPLPHTINLLFQHPPSDRSSLPAPSLPPGTDQSQSVISASFGPLEAGRQQTPVPPMTIITATEEDPQSIPHRINPQSIQSTSRRSPSPFNQKSVLSVN